MGKQPTLRLYDGYLHTTPERSSHVQILQRLLREKGFDLTVDGLYGPNTARAVETFQRNHVIEVDGIVGPVTWALLVGEPKPKEEGVYETTIPEDSPLQLHILDAAELYREYIYQAAERAGVAPAIIAGIGARETGWGTSTYLDTPGPTGRGDGGHGHGLMQIDDRSHQKFLSTDAWKSPEENIIYGAKVLRQSIMYVGQKTQLSGGHLLRAGVAGYNCGPGNVLRALRRGRDADYYTANRNYSSDVFNRAGWFQLHGWK